MLIIIYLYDVKLLLNYIAAQIDLTFSNCTPLSGGDIASVYLLEASNQKLVLKTSAASNALAMFQTEKLGLGTIAATKIIKTPEIYLSDAFQNTAFLLMEYIAAKRPDSKDFTQLGQALGQLHQINHTNFGFAHDNFIGSLPQFNNFHNTWLDFYISQRLLPQFQLAQQSGLLTLNEVPTKTILLQKGASLFQNVQPSLLHGDLWSGNYLIATDGTPYLIDPAVYFGHAEVDIAMTQLFGGFGPSFYEAYQEIHPFSEAMSVRQDWYQLYYLLVHLNLFGRSYYGQVKRIIGKIC